MAGLAQQRLFEDAKSPEFDSYVHGKGGHTSPPTPRSEHLTAEQIAKLAEKNKGTIGKATVEGRYDLKD